MKAALLGHETEVIGGVWAFLYNTKKEAIKALKEISSTYSENGKQDYTILPQSKINISDENYNESLNAYKQ